MSTYAIADAIDRFANNFKYAIESKNQIEKEKLAFEREKFEYYKKQFADINSICEHEWRYKEENPNEHNYECVKCGFVKSVPLSNIV